MTVLRLSRFVLRIAVSLALAIAILWAAAALWIDGPESRVLAGTLAGGLILIAALIAVLVRPWRRAAVAVSVPFAIVLGWWLTLRPSNDREWQPDVARLPTATLDGSLLTVRNVRNFEHRGERDFSEHWETRTYDLDTLVGFDMFVSFSMASSRSAKTWSCTRGCSGFRKRASRRVPKTWRGVSVCIGSRSCTPGGCQQATRRRR